MITKSENDIHQQGKENGGIKPRIDCVNEINKNYPENEATRICLNAVPSNIRDTEKYKKRLNIEREKNNILTQSNRPDFSDLGIGR